MKRFYALFSAIALMTTAAMAQVPAETCGAAVTFTGAAPWTAVGSTVGAIDNYNEVCPYTNAGGRDEVVAWNPPTSGYYDMSLCQGTTNFDSKLYVYAGSCPAPNSGLEIACSDDACANGATFPNPWISALTNVFMSTGTVYYIVVDAYSGADQGNFTLLVSPAAAPPTGSVLAIGEGRIYDYSFIPEYNLAASNFAAVVGNLGATVFNNVRVQMRVFSSADGFVAPISTIFSNVLPALNPTAIEVVTGVSGFTPPDTGTYIFEYVVQSPGGTGTTALDDTSFSFLVVDESSQERSYAFLGAPISAVRLATLGNAEYGVVQSYGVGGNVTGATLLISVDPVYAAEPITANLYEILGGNIDSLSLVATGSVPADTGALVYDIALSGSIAAGDYILSYAGNSFPVRTDEIYSQGSSDLVRGDVTGGFWGFFAGPYAWSFVALTEEAAAACNSAIPPTNQSHTVLSNRVRLDWTPNAGAVGCQVNGKRLPTGPQPSVNVLTAPYNTTNVPFAVAGAGTTWTWRVRCACTITPLDLSPYTAYGDTFSIPVAREGEILDVTLFPNPADNMLMVAYSGKGGEVNMTIVDMLGRVVLNRTELSVEGMNNTSFDVAGLENGNYFINMEEAGEVKTESFSVAH
ncbi:MAG: T9SS type A sorting domain-containing protein [Bacteroidetes bacterium]|nr:T9SS type A sorting domain-containing protein [Bacteroidota bacterium]